MASEARILLRGDKTAFWGARKFLYLDLGDGGIDVHIHKSSLSYTHKICALYFKIYFNLKYLLKIY